MTYLQWNCETNTITCHHYLGFNANTNDIFEYNFETNAFDRLVKHKNTMLFAFLVTQILIEDALESPVHGIMF